MKTVQMSEYGSEEQFKLVDVPKPQPQAGQILVGIAATSFNPIDPKRASGAMRQIFPVEFPFTPGGDFSGVVESAGQGADGFKAGDEVFGYSMPGGAYAEYLAIGASQAALKPKSVNHVEAASLAMVSLTALQMLDRAGVKKGQTVLIHGAGGAVGGVAVQAAHQRGIKVIGTASAASLDRVRSYGAEKVIDYNAAQFENEVKDVDAVLDTVGGAVQQRSYGVIKSGGVLVAASQPPSQDEAKKHNVTAGMIQTEVSSAGLQTLARMIDAGEIKPCVGKVYPLSEVAQGWRDAKSKHIEGKIVFTPGA
jgi:NADPH:quinone reductase-like Zn-dependent oxidoreductase